MQSDRRGQSQSALREVQGRHLAIQKIERQVVELAQLFEDMNVLVVQQEPVVERVNQQAEAVHENVDRANTELNGAVKKARAARRKKWYCLGIIGEFPCRGVVFSKVANKLCSHHSHHPRHYPWYRLWGCQEVSLRESTLTLLRYQCSFCTFHRR